MGMSDFLSFFAQNNLWKSFKKQKNTQSSFDWEIPHAIFPLWCKFNSLFLFLILEDIHVKEKSYFQPKKTPFLWNDEKRTKDLK